MFFPELRKQMRWAFVVAAIIFAVIFIIVEMAR